MHDDTEVQRSTISAWVLNWEQSKAGLTLEKSIRVTICCCGIATEGGGGGGGGGLLYETLLVLVKFIGLVKIQYFAKKLWWMGSSLHAQL